jgi:KilA-N domain
MEIVLSKAKKYFDNEKICYQQIFKSYWYANYGDLTVVIHKELGYVNASLLCKTYKKQFGHWHRNKNTKAIIAGLAEKISTNGAPVTAEQMVITVKGGSGAYKKHICGTYVHPILFPHIASWLDHTFAGVVSIMVNNFFGLQTKTGDLTSILEDMKQKPEPKDEEDEDDVSDVEDVVPEKLKKTFKIFARNDPKFPYQVIEVDTKKMDAAVKRFRKSPAGTQELLLEINNIPDVVNLYSMIKASGIIQTNKNAFKSKFPKEVLIEKIKELSLANATRETWVNAIAKSDLAMSDDELSTPE